MGASRSPLGGELEGVAEGATAPSMPAKGVREGEGVALGVALGEKRPAAYTAEAAARCTRKVSAERGTPRPLAVAEKSTAGLLKAHRSASSTTSSMGATTTAAAGAVTAAAAERGSGVGAASLPLSDSAPPNSSCACSSPSHASSVVRAMPSGASCSAGRERGPGRFASEVREKAVSVRRYVKAVSSASRVRKDCAEGVEVGEGVLEGVRVGEGVGVAVSVEVAVAELVAVVAGVPLPAAVPLTVAVARGEADAEGDAEADFVEEGEGSCVLVAVFEAEAQREREADSEGVAEGCGEPEMECVSLGDADSVDVFVSVRVGVSVVVPHVEADADTQKDVEMEARMVTVAFALPEAVAEPLTVACPVRDARAESVPPGVAELDSVPEEEGVTVSVPEADSVPLPEPVMEPLSVGEEEPVRLPVPDSLGEMVAVAHTVTVPVTVGEAVAVKLREVVMDTLPVSDWHGEGENVVLPLDVLLAVTEDVRVMVGV